MENNNTMTLLNEGAIQDFIRAIFGKNFKTSVGAAAEGLLNKALTDVVSGGKKFTIASLRKTPEFKKAISDLMMEASRVKYGKSFDELSKFDKNAATKLADDIQNGIEKQVADRAAVGKNLIDADVKAAQSNVNKVTKQVNAGKATAADLKAATKELKANVKAQTKWSEAQKAISGMDKMTVGKIQKLVSGEAKVTTGTGSNIAGTVGPNVVVQTKTGIFTMTKEQLKKFPGKIKKVVVNNKILTGLAALGLTGAALYYFFGATDDSSTILVDENGNPIDDSKKIGGEWLPCIKQMIASKEGTIAKSPRTGEISVLVKNSEYPGGIQYYPDGKVLNVATMEKGTYVCKDGSVLKESKPTINEVVGRILRERLLKEQGTEVSDATMDKYVDDAVDDLDGYVAEYNLKSLKNILTNLKGKTYKGEDAIKKFLQYYQEDEGVDFVTDVKSVGVANLSVVAKNMKPEIIALATGASSNVPKPDNSNKSGGGSGTIITWDKDKKKADGGNSGGGGNSRGGGTKKKKSSYKNCEGQDFPLSYGCKSSKIAEVQKCLGVKDDGAFGPNTMKALVDNKYDTSRGLSKDVYDAVKGNCNPTQRRKLDTTIEKLPVKGLKMSSLAPDSIKMPDLSKMIQSNQPPIDFYNVLKDAGYMRGDANETTLEDGTVLPATNRVKYKGPELDDDILGKLDDILKGKGYERIKQKIKGYGEKYVWLQQ